MTAGSSCGGTIQARRRFCCGRPRTHVDNAEGVGLRAVGASARCCKAKRRGDPVGTAERLLYACAAGWTYFTTTL